MWEQANSLSMEVSELKDCGLEYRKRFQRGKAREVGVPEPQNEDARRSFGVLEED
jgi:hypothetical protein